MSRRFSNRRRVSRGTSRQLVWARRSGGFAVTAAAAPAFAAPVRDDVLASLVQAHGASLLGSTIVRVRGLMAITAPPATGTAGLTAAMYIGDANDVVRGPNANDNYYDSNSTGKDYFLIEPFLAPVQVAATEPLDGSVVISRLIDSKSSRKLEEVSQRLILDVSAFSNNAGTVGFNIDLSVLVMLP